MESYKKIKEKNRKKCGYENSYLSSTKRRINVQMLGSFIRNGGEREFINNNSFFQRESNAFSAMEETLKKKYSEEETDQIIQHVIGYMAVIQEIYFNLGVKAGAMLHCKLTDNFETDI